MPVAARPSAQSIPIFQWKFLSPAGKAAVDASLEAILHQSIKNVTLIVLDENGKPYTGLVRVTQDSTSFIFSVGGLAPGDLELRSQEYLTLTPSRSYRLWCPWKEVEPSNGSWNGDCFRYVGNLLRQNGLVDLHVDVGPYTPLGSPSTLPEWATALKFDALKNAMKQYVEAMASHFKGQADYYHLWPEANMGGANGNWPLDQIVEIIKMEALTIRAIDPRGKICVDLYELSSNAVQAVAETYGTSVGMHSWATEVFVEHLLDAQVPFDVIGIEPRYGSGWVEKQGGIDTLYNRLIALERFGKEIFIYEDAAASYIKPSLVTDRGFWAPQYLWHGQPSEEKQAEYMIAETIIALGNPKVTGVRFFALVDGTDRIPELWFTGVVYENGTKKQAFYTLRDFWGNLTTHTTIQSMNGIPTFIGLAGEYTVTAEGYLPVKIQVTEEPVAQSIKVTLTSANLRTVSTSTSGASQASTLAQTQAPSTGKVILAVAATAGIILVIVLIAFRIRRKKNDAKFAPF